MRRLLKVVTSLVALAFGLEAGTRADEAIRWGTPVTSTAASVADIISIDSSGARGIPGRHYRQFAINSLGLRGPEPAGGRPRVLVLGASETFGLYERAGLEYPRQLEDSLRVLGCRVDVLNAGLPGFSLPTLTQSYVRQLRGLHASVVLLYPTPVQYLEDATPVYRAPAVPVHPDPPQRPRFVRRLRDHLKVVLPKFVQTYLRQREIAASTHASGAAPWTTVPADRLAAYTHDVLALADSIRADGATAVIATHANAFGDTPRPGDTDRLIAWAKFYPRATPDLLPRFDRVANDSLRVRATAQQLPVLDLAGHMRAGDPDRMFADFSHFSEAGSARVAGFLSRGLLRAAGCPTH